MKAGISAGGTLILMTLLIAFAPDDWFVTGVRPESPILVMMVCAAFICISIGDL